MKTKNHSSMLGYTIGIVALFLAGFFLLVIFGARSYKGTVDGQNENFRTRALLSYFSTTIRANDVSGSVSFEQLSPAEAKEALGDKALADGETFILSVVDPAVGFGLYIYPYDGKLLEEYTAIGAPHDTENAQEIGETQTFTIENVGGSNLRITTDAGSVVVHPRSEGGVS